ncbi:MAG TPA: PepSY domain-containing protein [Xanthomonadales bacterium]|nr:PepSY domain-containing protein [Xanthomonadales bacterium]
MQSIVRFAFIVLLSLLALLPVDAATLKEAIEQVERETGGKVLSADTIRTRGTVVYRIKVLMPDGRVRVFQIPA